MRLLRKIQFTYMLKNRSKRSLHQPQSCCFYQDFGLRNHLLWAKVYPLLEDKESSCCGKSRCETCFNKKKINAFVTIEKNVLLRFVNKNIYKSNHQNHLIVSALFIFYIVRCVAYSISDQLLINFVGDGITKTVPIGLHWKVVISNKTTCINIA